LTVDVEVYAPTAQTGEASTAVAVRHSRAWHGSAWDGSARTMGNRCGVVAASARASGASDAGA
jgi:hypothetical protein